MAMRAADVDETECSGTPMHPQAASHWSRDYVSCAESMGVRLFVNLNMVNLDRPALRAEVLTIIHDSFDDDVLPIYSTFNDTSGHIYEGDIARAQLYGIISGDTNDSGVEVGTFRPDDPINRAETSKIIYQRMKEEAREEVDLK